MWVLKYVEGKLAFWWMDGWIYIYSDVNNGWSLDISNCFDLLVSKIKSEIKTVSGLKHTDQSKK